MKKVLVYIPWSYYFDDRVSRRFLKNIVKTLHSELGSPPLLLSLRKLRFSNTLQVDEFIAKHNIGLLVEHDSHKFSNDPHYTKTASMLRDRLPAVNSSEAHQIGYSKIDTKQRLKEHNLPVLDHLLVNTVDDLYKHMNSYSVAVIKPHNSGAGYGVRLIRKVNEQIEELYNNQWFKLQLREITRDGSTVINARRTPSLTILLSIAAALTSCATALHIAPLLAPFVLLTTSFLLWIFIEHFDFQTRYSPIILEHYFNDDPDGYSSLRCTVIGDQVVEAVKRVNKKNITSNVSNGGTASRAELTDTQRDLAIAAAKAVGADYAGVDMLVCSGKTVIGEVNTSCITFYEDITGVDSGELLAKYISKKYRNILSRN